MELLDIGELQKRIDVHCKFKINGMNYDEIIKCAKFINTDGDKIAAILGNKLSLIDRNENDNFETYNLLFYEKEFDLIDRVIMQPRDAILLIMQSVNTKNFKVCEKDVKHDFCNLPNEIRNPPVFKFGNIYYDNGARRVIARDYRYINNFDVKDAINKIDKILPVDLTKPGLRDYEREANLYDKYIRTVLNQSRSINIARMCFASLLIARVGGKNEFIHSCCQEINPALYYLAQLFNNFDTWPFIDQTEGMRINDSKSFSSQLPILTYCVLNRAISWNLGVVTTGYFNLCMEIYYTWAKTSLDDEHLLQKGKLNSLRKLLNERVKTTEIIPTYDKSGLSGTRTLDDSKEFWFEGEKQEMIDMLNKQSNGYTSQVKILLNGSYTVNELIAHRMALACVTNPSNYKKSTPILEYDRSAEHKIHQPIRTPFARLVYNSFPVEPRYYEDTQISKCWKILRKYAPKIRQDLNGRQFEQEFWDRLTNNSAGIVTTNIAEKRKTNALLLAMPSIPYGQRYVSGLVDNEVLYDRVEAINAISQRVKAGKREQIDRRSRWIMMVANVLQAVFSVALTYGRSLTKITNYIASGKQNGDIRDMLQVLRASSTKEAIITDNDIRGMDSSTQEQVADMILHVVFDSLKGIKCDNFFYAKSEKINCTVYDESGSAIGHEEVEINAVQSFMIDIIGKMRPGEYQLDEGWVQDVVYIAGSVFWSGAFHTAVQHNTILHSVLEDLNNEVRSSNKGINADFNAAVLGDDISIEMLFTERSDRADDAARNIINRLITKLRELGFEADPESARFQSTFLQQTGFMGKVEPKHARLSIITSERGEGRGKDPFSQIKEIGDILDEMSSRAITPANAIEVLHSLWLVGRIISIRKTMNIQVNKDLRSWIKDQGAYYRLIIPFSSIYLPEVFGSTPPPMHTYKYGTLYPGYYSPKGSFFYWYLSNAVIYHPESTTSKTIKDKYNEVQQRRMTNLYKNNKISSGRYQQARTLRYVPPRYTLIDHSIPRKIGFIFGQWLYSTLPKAKRVSDKEVETPVFGKLVLIGQAKQDQRAAASAHLAKHLLSEKGITVPDTLAYYNQPLNRIKQAFAQKRTTVRKNALLDYNFIEKLKHYNAVPDSKLIITRDHSIDFDIHETEYPIELSREASIVNNIDFGPCCNKGSEIWHLVLLFGTPFGTPSVDALLSSFKEELSAGADIEVILEKAADIYKQDPTMLEPFLVYIGIHRSQFAKVRALINDYSSYAFTNYRSVLSKRKHFFTDTLTTSANNLFLKVESSSLKRKWTKLQYVIARDWFHAFPQTKNKLIIRPRYGVNVA